jgi:hypothetical protein
VIFIVVCLLLAAGGIAFYIVRMSGS